MSALLLTRRIGMALCREMSYIRTAARPPGVDKPIFGRGDTIINAASCCWQNHRPCRKNIRLCTDNRNHRGQSNICRGQGYERILPCWGNRVQCVHLDHDILKFLGREHDVAEALSALDTVRHNFDNLSIDLIYATAGQTINDWQNTLSQALAFDLPHLSLYQLTIEPGTVFYTRQRNGETLHLDDDHAADLFELTQHMTAAAGLPSYEISNHGKPTAQCQHNINYWQAGDWIGIGPGAHGRYTIAANNYKNLQRVGTTTRRSPAGWLQSVQKTGHGIDTYTHDGADAFATEMIMMGLRLTTGVSVQKIESICGPRDKWLDNAAVTQAIEDGWLDGKQHNASGIATDLRATDAGRLRLNHIIAMILR